VSKTSVIIPKMKKRKGKTTGGSSRPETAHPDKRAAGLLD
jgi:hypothetical protein